MGPPLTSGSGPLRAADDSPPSASGPLRAADHSLPSWNEPPACLWGRSKRAKAGVTCVISICYVPEKWIDHAGGRRSLDKLILDQTNSVTQTCGRQKRKAQPSRRPNGTKLTSSDDRHRSDDTEKPRPERAPVHRLAILPFAIHFPSLLSPAFATSVTTCFSSCQESRWYC